MRRCCLFFLCSCCCECDPDAERDALRKARVRARRAAKKKEVEALARIEERKKAAAAGVAAAAEEAKAGKKGGGRGGKKGGGAAKGEEEAVTKAPLPRRDPRGDHRSGGANLRSTAHRSLQRPLTSRHRCPVRGTGVVSQRLCRRAAPLSVRVADAIDPLGR